MDKQSEQLMDLRGASTSRFNLYPDFTLTKDNCASEPIHRPIAIQGHGHLLVFDVAGEPRLYAVSGRLAECLGMTIEELWSEPLAHWVPDSILQLQKNLESTDHEPRCLTHALGFAGSTFQVTHYQQSGKLCFEFEPVADIKTDPQIICSIANRFRQIDCIDSLYIEATKQIAQAFEYDRVMIYQFDHDQHGCVVGEQKRDHLESFLGLHYPETDIPKMARDLFLLIKSRAISDVNVHNDRLLFNPESGPNLPHLDLSYSQLRATSPIHIQYLQNMGVTATLTLAIIIQGKLWGLVACHHYTPRQILFNDKLIGEAIADLLAKRIFELEMEKQRRNDEAARAVEASLLEQVRMSENYRVQILEHASSIIGLCEADGAALITLDLCVHAVGLVPSDTALMNIREWLVNNGHDEVFSTADFNGDIPVPMEESRSVGGMLSACISTLSQSYLLWFRKPVSQTVDWAGDPENSYDVEMPNGSGDVQLSPRQSFAKWQVTVEGQSMRWESGALEMADRVRQGIFKKELLHSAMLVDRSNKEFMQLTFAAAHDLQEPLRTQANYLELIKDSLETEEYDDLKRFVDRTQHAAIRMSDLVTDLLSYSRLGVSSKNERVDLSALMDVIGEELEAKLSESQARLSVDALPVIRGDSSKLKQLMQNLVTNAIKYVNPGVRPDVSIFLEEENSFWTLNVRDNGIGIDSEHHSKIFVMFKRLHGKNEYEGSGIGLAICAKVAESMGAELGVTSATGQGSTFWLRFHNSIIVRDL